MHHQCGIKLKNLKPLNFQFCQLNTRGSVISENINSNSAVIDCFFDARILNDLVWQIHLLTGNIVKHYVKQTSKQYSYDTSWETAVQKYYFVALTASRFPYVKLYPSPVG